MNTHVIKAEKSALFDFGISQVVPEFLNGLKELGKVSPEYLIALHSHFDHLGGITRLKEAFPSAKVVGSKLTNNVYKDNEIKELYIKTMTKISDNEMFKMVYPDSDNIVKYEAGKLDIVVKEGDEIEIGEGRKLKIYETPGHTPCNISVFDETTKTLFVSDSCGIPFFTGRIWPTAFQDFEIYKNSMKKLIALKPEFLCLSHVEFISGKEVMNFLNRSLAETDNYRDSLIRLMKENNGDVKTVIDILFSDYQKEISYIQPNIFRYGNKQMLEQIKKELISS